MSLLADIGCSLLVGVFGVTVAILVFLAFRKQGPTTEKPASDEASSLTKIRALLAGLSDEQLLQVAGLQYSAHVADQLAQTARTTLSPPPLLLD